MAQVIVDQNSYQTDRIFDYMIPTFLQQDIQKGMRVLVPFGKGNKRLEAYVLNIEEKCIDDISVYKEIIEAIDYLPILSEEQIKMILWMKNKYLCKYIEAIHCLIPTGIVQKERKIISITQMNWRNEIPHIQNKQRSVLEALEANGGAQSLEILEKNLVFKEIFSAIKHLAEEKIIEIKYDLFSRVKMKTEEYARLIPSEEELVEIIPKFKGAKKQAEILEYLNKKGKNLVSGLIQELNTSRGPLRALVEKGYVELVEEIINRDPFFQQEVSSFPKLKPSEEQQKIINKIIFAIQKSKPETYLIHGVTGSGKTEIYLRLIEEVIVQGKQGIVLVPEISLTPQTVERFRGRFGDEGIALLHSSLSEGERYDEWRRIAGGEVKIVIGARSAIFAPLKNLGIIIIDEEHENTYKSEQNPKYHAAEIAAYRSINENAIVLLGSATPSLETYYKAEKGDMKLMTLTHRVQQSKLPNVEIIDMKIELEEGNQGILSRRLMTLINENLNKKKQTILFLNRRGFSTFVSCKGCGHVIKCEHCDISMTLHMPQNHLKCHYCGEKQFSPSCCPECGSETIKFMGAGTQKLEKIIGDLFPTATISRLDMDSTSQKGSHQKVLGSFKRGEIDILIGTQMISKGLDFPNVTLVGIISVDSTLNLPDFRGAEKTFQLITQVAGRAGRGVDEGVVILQTFNPQHYSIQTASRHSYSDFYNEELMIRREFEYPPFSNLISINFSGKNEKEVSTYAEKMANMIKYVLKGKGCSKINDVLLGPNESIITRINQKYRFQIILKDQEIEYNLLKGIVKYFFIQHRQKYVPKTIAVSIDTNPYNMM